MISSRYFDKTPSSKIRGYLNIKPWPHLVLDNFLDEEIINSAINEIAEYDYKFDIDYRGKGRIEYSLLRSELLWRAMYSSKMISILSKAFKLNIKLNKDNLIQLRRMDSCTPAFPVHNDHILGMDSLVAFLYLSKDWNPDCGGHLLLHKSNKKTEVNFKIAPIFNRLVVFQTKSTFWHSVEKVNNWSRLSALAVWDIKNNIT